MGIKIYEKMVENNKSNIKCSFFWLSCGYDKSFSYFQILFQIEIKDEISGTKHFV